MDEKINLLTENSISVAQNTSDVLESDYLGESGRGSVIVICNTLMQISNAIEADCFITNINGDVVYSRIWRSIRATVWFTINIKYRKR